jgi:hypothetical protein
MGSLQAGADGRGASTTMRQLRHESKMRCGDPWLRDKPRGTGIFGGGL